MIKIIKKNKTAKKEDAHVIPFLEFYYSGSKKDLKFSDISEGADKKPDYFINTSNTLLEVKEIHDMTSNQKHAQWGKIANKLQKAIDNNELLDKVQGTFLINTPEVFKTPTEEKTFKEVSSVILSAVIKNEKTVRVFKVDFEINKVSNQERIVVFGNIGQGGFIDPSNVIYQNTKDKIDTANKQLGNPPSTIKASKKILLLVNKYYFPLWDWDLFKAISRVYKELLTYKNIDEIWYQFETKDKGFVYKLLYKESFFEQLEASNFKKYQKEDLELFANWFSALSEMGDEQKEKLFFALKQFLKMNKPFEIFPEVQTRIEMVRFGIWLSEKSRFKDIIWFIEQFITDPDPADPKSYEGDPVFNYDKQIRDGGDPRVITSVLGHLAWVVQKLVLDKTHVIQGFNFTKKLLSHPNLYVKLQALIPLSELSARRQWLQEYDEKNSTNYYKDFRETVFELVENYSEYKATANGLSNIFYYFKDLDTKEAIKVLDKLKISSEAAPLFLYFGVFRKRHYKNIPFDPSPLEQRLKSIITEKDDKYIDLKGSIAWNIWRVLEENPNEFEALKTYIDLFLTLPYNKRYYSSLDRVIEEWIEKKPEIVIDWFMKMLNELQKYIGDDVFIGQSTWIEPEKPLQFIAKNLPSELENVVGKLVKLWKLGAFVGSPKEIFETYKLVDNLELKKQLVKKFKQWYEEMKKLNPKIQEIVWV